MALVGSLRTWGMIMFSHLKFREAIAAGRIASPRFPHARRARRQLGGDRVPGADRRLPGHRRIPALRSMWRRSGSRSLPLATGWSARRTASSWSDAAPAGPSGSAGRAFPHARSEGGARSVTFAEIEGAGQLLPRGRNHTLHRLARSCRARPGPRSGSSWRASSAPARSSRAVPWSSSLASRPSSAAAASSPCLPAITLKG